MGKKSEEFNDYSKKRKKEKLIENILKGAGITVGAAALLATGAVVGPKVIDAVTQKGEKPKVVATAENEVKTTTQENQTSVEEVNVTPVLAQTSSTQEVINDELAVVATTSTIYKKEDGSDVVAIRQDVISENTQETKSVVIDNNGNVVENVVLVSGEEKISTSEAMSKGDVDKMLENTTGEGYVVTATFDENGKAVKVDVTPTKKSNVEENVNVATLVVTPKQDKTSEFLFNPTAQKEEQKEENVDPVETVLEIIADNIDKLPEDVQEAVENPNTVITLSKYKPVKFSLNADVVTNFKDKWAVGVGPRFNFVDRTTGETIAAVQMTGFFSMTPQFETVLGGKIEGAVRLGNDVAIKGGVAVLPISASQFEVYGSLGATIQFGANNSKVSVDPTTNIPTIGWVIKENPGPSPSPTPEQDPYKYTTENTGTNISGGVPAPGTSSHVAPKEQEESHETGFVDPSAKENPDNQKPNDMVVGPNTHIDFSTSGNGNSGNQTSAPSTNNQTNTNDPYGNTANQAGQIIDHGVDFGLIGF